MLRQTADRIVLLVEIETQGIPGGTTVGEGVEQVDRRVGAGGTLEGKLQTQTVRAARRRRDGGKVRAVVVGKLDGCHHRGASRSDDDPVVGGCRRVEVVPETVWQLRLIIVVQNRHLLGGSRHLVTIAGEQAEGDGFRRLSPGDPVRSFNLAVVDWLNPD